MTDDRANAYAKGVMGETAACEYLCQRGMELLTRRFHSPFGEIDLVMADGDELVFVEVKAREHGSARDGLDAVNPGKRRRIIETARCFLGDHPEYAARVTRFDIVTVTREGIRHLPNAFEGGEW